MKEITINDKKYKIDCNAFTYVKYPSFFENGIIDDMNIVRNYLVKQTLLVNKYKQEGKAEEEIYILVSQILSNEIDKFIIKVTQIAWILIYTANEQIDSYENWLKGLKKFSISDKWISEVTEVAVNTFCGQ